MKKILPISLVMVVLTALVFGIGVENSDKNKSEYALGHGKYINAEISDEFSVKTGTVSGFNAESDKLLGYNFIVKKYFDISDKGKLFAYDNGRDNSFSFLLGVLSNGYLSDSSSVNSSNSAVSDARIAVGEFEAYFEERDNSKVGYGSFESKDSYKTYIYLYSTKDTFLSGSEQTETGLTVYNVNLHKGWNRVVGMHKDNLFLIENGEIENPEWVLEI